MMLEVRGISVRFGGVQALSDVSLTVPAGGITALIGPNGAGKTTLFGVVSGFIAPGSGSVRFLSEDVTGRAPHQLCRAGLVRTFQIVQPFAAQTVRENIAVGSHLAHASRREALAHAESIAARLGLEPQLDKLAADLTVAGRKRLELARALATGPRLLLLDEVLAGLNPREIAEVLPVVRGIRDSGVTVLMVEHVMQAVMSLADTVFVLSEGRLIAQGPPARIAADALVIEAYLGRRAARAAHA
jgi:branched-chain amino acid transport system ATP-binding protein